MIKLFRKIRYDLMEKNNTGKPALPAGRYFKYAIGEIVLVVIGILIALQINNWNEEKKARLRSLTLLENLVGEIKQDSIYFDNVYHAEKNIFLNAAHLLFNAHADSGFVIENDSVMGMAFRFACFTPVIKFSDNAYIELTSSDLLNKFKSETLKNDLHEYYSQIKFLNMYSEQTHQISNDLIDELANYYMVTPAKKTESRMISNFSGAGEEQFSTQYDIVSFRQNKSLNPKLYDMIDIHKDRLGGLEIIKTLGQSIQKEAIGEIKGKN